MVYNLSMFNIHRKKLLYTALGVVVVCIVALFVLSQLNPSIPQPPEDQFFFKKVSSGFGNCEPDGICRQEIILYDSGRIILRGVNNNEQEMDEQAVGYIKYKIRESGVIKNVCSGGTTHDYWATYTILIDGQKKIIEFPNCKEELDVLDKIIYKHGVQLEPFQLDPLCCPPDKSPKTDGL